MDSNQQGRNQYEIVGGDGEIYGPYSLEDLQQYLNEQRVQSDTQVRVSGTDDWMELNRLISPPAAEPAVAAESSVAKPSGRRASSSGKVDAMEALGASWNVFKDTMGLSIGVYFVASLLIAISGCLIIGPLFLAGPIWGGVCIYSLKVIRGEPGEFGDLFSGFSNFGGYLAAFFLILIMVAISTLPGLLVMIAPSLILGPDGAIVAISALLGIFLMVLLPVYYSLRYMFTFLLLADGRADSAGEALKMSAAGVRQNIGGILLFFLLAALISGVAGMTVVGSLFSSPWLGIAIAKIYEDVYS